MVRPTSTLTGSSPPTSCSASSPKEWPRIPTARRIRGTGCPPELPTWRLPSLAGNDPHSLSLPGTPQALSDHLQILRRLNKVTLPFQGGSIVSECRLVLPFTLLYLAPPVKRIGVSGV